MEMTTVNQRCIGVVVFFLAVAGASATAAQGSKQANLKVTAQVIGNCLVTTQDLAFGNYDPVGANATTPADATGLIELTCSRGLVATIALGLGQNAQATTRRMADPGAGRLEYELYQDGGRTVVWGGPGAGDRVLPAAPSTATRLYAVYGRVRQGQDQPVGAYTDTVVVTVTF
jgi:spore coat protein U-like protein